jgi:hypothetical protein
MNINTANTITELARKMLVDAKDNFTQEEYIDSVKLFCDIVSNLLPPNIDKALEDSNNSLK